MKNNLHTNILCFNLVFLKYHMMQPHPGRSVSDLYVRGTGVVVVMMVMMLVVVVVLMSLGQCCWAPTGGLEVY